ncbi:hypothetical protein [Candidatus Uabimicrobium amorphum]|uniref:Oxygen tolerance n=1 Tax=Uabimicrobium amorphum TaxID=2596890 RepID=A0A5S9F239_UABAM|nr:hypothetical protein [Candidatus Uabimicrobium amorphum]BBM81702.1 hypothetical protein UABAM_00041 [Candidatus Uabimicrobium amorphum]
MKTYFTFFLLIVAICSCNQHTPSQKKVISFHKEFQRGPLTISIDFSPEKPTIADRILFELRVIAHKDYDVKMPEFADNIGNIFYVFSFFPQQVKVKDQKHTYTHNYELEALVSGKVTIPALKILYNKNKTTGKEFTAMTDPIEVEVKAIELDSSKKDIYDIQNVMSLRASNFYLLLACIAVGVILLFFVVKAITPKSQDEKQPEDRRSPEEIAWEQLKALLEQQHIENKKYQEFYFALTMIVRQYIEKKYDMKASGQTTEEFLDEIKQSEIFDAKRKRDFSEFLEATDFVKYAAQDPQEKEVTVVFEAAKKFMNLQT